MSHVINFADLRLQSGCLCCLQQERMPAATHKSMGQRDCSSVQPCVHITVAIALRKELGVATMVRMACRHILERGAGEGGG